MPARRIVISTIVALAAMTRVASGDPVNLHMRTPSTCETEGGTKLQLPPGYFLDEESHDRLDREVRRLQDAETRLVAENRSLRGTLSSWQPGWVVLVVAVAGGVALGVYAGSKL